MSRVGWALSIVLLLAGAAAADSRLEAAQKAFDNGDYRQVMTLVQEIEQSTGVNLRLQSMKAIALDELDHEDAFDEMAVYFQLAKGRSDLARDATHQELKQRFDERRRKLATAVEADRKKLDAFRAERTKQAMKEVERKYKRVADKDMKARLATFDARVEAARVLNEMQAPANGLTVSRGGTDWRVVLDQESFALPHDFGRLLLQFEHPTTKAIETETFDRSIAFRLATSIEAEAAPCTGCAGVVRLHLSKPIAYTRATASASERLTTSVVTFFHRRGDPIAAEMILQRVIAAAVPPTSRGKLAASEKLGLGRVLLKHDTASPTFADAIELLRLADAAGSLTEPRLLADALYLLGHRDAWTYYGKAAEAGDHEAKLRLGELYLDRNRSEARVWFERAAVDGDAVAMMKAAELNMDHDHLAARLWVERAMKAGQPKPAFFDELERRVARVERLRALPIQKRVAVWEPEVTGRFLGKPLAALQRVHRLAEGGKERSTRIDATNEFYTRGDAANHEPLAVRVSRTGIIVGESFLVEKGQPRHIAALTFNRYVSELEEVFGKDIVQRESEGRRKGAVTIVGEYPKTIYVAMIEESDQTFSVVLDITDHDLEIHDLEPVHVAGRLGVLGSGAQGPADLGGVAAVTFTFSVDFQLSRYLWVDGVADAQLMLMGTSALVDMLAPDDAATSDDTVVFGLLVGPRIRLGTVNHPWVGLTVGPTYLSPLDEPRANIDTVGLGARLEIATSRNAALIIQGQVHDDLTILGAGLSFWGRE